MTQNLDELLLRSGLVTPENLAAARADAARTRKRLAEALIDLGLVGERSFAEWMARTTGAPLVDAIPEDAAAVQHRVNAAVARELQVVPLRVVDDQLFVVMLDVLDRSAIEVLQATAGLQVRPMAGIRSEIQRAVNRLYPAPDEAPFQFSSETLLRRPAELDFLREPADVEFGTIVAGRLPRELSPSEPEPETEPRAGDITAPTNPFIAIERRLDQIVQMVRNLETRLDDLTALLHDQGALKR